MPDKEIASFRVRRVEVLDPEGNADPSLDPNLPEEVLQDLYRNMLTAREFDRRAVKLQRQGRMGTYAPFEGHEAIQMAGVLALDPSDPIFPSYRDSAAIIQRGVPLERILLYWMGREKGNRSPDEAVFPINIGVGTQMLHAVGAAYAGRLLGRDQVALSFFGDGATSQGDFYEALNFAGAWRTPSIFLCQNNRWAISVPLAKQTAAGTLAQKAVAAGIEGIQVDGNDVLAVYRVVREAVEKARSGGGPTLVEALTYRIAIHTTSDDPTRYQSEEERAEWAEREPLRRFRLYLERKGLWSEEEEKVALEEIGERIREAVKKAEADAVNADPREMFESAYASLTPTLRRQMEQLVSDGQEVGQ
jgi:pyruvate dehydrogenase E1 component alpha subunit